MTDEKKEPDAKPVSQIATPPNKPKLVFSPKKPFGGNYGPPQKKQWNQQPRGKMIMHKSARKR